MEREREKERARLQKMGSTQTDSLLQSRKKRSFRVPSFRRSSASERQEVAARSEEVEAEAARVQKAAAWQWYTRGVGAAVLPTKRPPAGKSPPSQPPIDELQKKPVLEAPLIRAASRFKDEARFTPPTSASAPSACPSTPLYDEFELSGLRTQMADFVQRLPKAPPPAAAASDHQLTKPTPSAAPVASTIPFHMKPFSALHKLFRKLVSGSIIKSTKNSPRIRNSSEAVYEPQVFPEEEEENPQFHYHHYIHHHHHHYHYGENPEESDVIIRSQRRHSESSGIRPHIPSPWEAESVEEEEAAERSPIEAYLAQRRRRHSDTFAALLTAKKANFDEEEEVKGQSAKAASPLQLLRKYNSQMFSPNKIAVIDSKDLAQPAAGGTDEGFLDIKNRRHSAENNREAPALEWKGVGLGGKSGGGTYKLSGAADGAMPEKPLVRRRHSEGLQRPEGVHFEMGKHTPSSGRPYWHSPSARYVEDVIERQIGASTMAGPAPARRSLPHRDLPPIYSR